MNGSRAGTADRTRAAGTVNAKPPMSAPTAPARRPATVDGRERLGQRTASRRGNIAGYDEIWVRNRWPASSPGDMPISGPSPCAALALRGGNLPWRRASSPADASADDPDVDCLGPLLALRDVQLDLLPFLQAAVAATGDRADVHEHVRPPSTAMKQEPLSPLNHFTVPCAILTFLVADAAPAMAGVRTRHDCLWPACHRTRGGCRPCDLPAARRLELPARPASAAGANTRADGARPAEAPRS
jgi:hypothetical protein